VQKIEGSVEDWSTLQAPSFYLFFPIYTMNRNSVPFPDAAAAAFGRKSRDNAPKESRSGFADVPATAFGRLERRPANGGAGGFDEAAAAAFGKKPRRNDTIGSTSVPQARSNSFGYILNQALGPTERLYEGSALTVQRRKAQEAEEAKKKDITRPEAWPELGSKPSAAPVTSTVDSAASSSPSSPSAPSAPSAPKPTFADLIRKRAAEEEAAEAKAREEWNAAEEVRKREAAAKRAFIGIPRIASRAPTSRFGYNPDDDDNEGGMTPPYSNDLLDDNMYRRGSPEWHPHEGDDEGDAGEDNAEDAEDNEANGGAGEVNPHLYRGY